MWFLSGSGTEPREFTNTVISFNLQMRLYLTFAMELLRMYAGLAPNTSSFSYYGLLFPWRLSYPLLD